MIATVATTAVPTQVTLPLAANERSARVDEAFVALMRSGMTRRDLLLNINRRPAIWVKYSHWLDRLPQ
jgi:hypothetical protein